MDNYIADITNELLRCFDIINLDKFNGELIQPIITIQEGKRGTLGHCSTKKIWIINKNEEKTNDNIENDENEKANNSEVDNSEANNSEVDLIEQDGVFYEINIGARYLDYEPNELLGILLHEMVHLKNNMDDVNDCSGKKHNKKFKKLAEQVGLICDKDEKVGYGYTHNSDELEDYFSNKVKLNKDLFKYYRYIPLKPAKEKEPPKNFISYICPSCGKEGKGEEGIKLVCEDCDVELEVKPKAKRGRKSKNDD